MFLPKIFLVGFKSQLPPQLMKNKEICKISVLICSATDCDFCQSANLQVQTLHLSCQIFQTEIDQEIEIWCFSFFFKSQSVLIQNQEKWIGWNQPKDWTQQILILNL